MVERPGVITMNRRFPYPGRPGKRRVGGPAPDFVVLANDLSPFAASKGKVAIICRCRRRQPICDTETHWFNEEATSWVPTSRLVIISMDLPFAQRRWCGAAGVERGERPSTTGTRLLAGLTGC